MQILRVLSRALPVRKRSTNSGHQQMVLAGRPKVSRGRRARGVALLVCMFVMLIVSSLVIFALNMDATEMAITRNTLDLSRALYLADAGIQHALGMIRADRSWRAGFGSPGVEFPPGSGAYYIVTVTDGPGGEVIVTSTGDTGGLSKTVRATIAVP